MNQDLEALLYKINKIAGREDPEEVIQSVDLPSDEWIAIVDGERHVFTDSVPIISPLLPSLDFIQSEYPELVVDIQEEALPDRPIRTKYQNNPETLAQVKQRTLGKGFVCYQDPFSHFGKHLSRMVAHKDRQKHVSWQILSFFLA